MRETKSAVLSISGALWQQQRQQMYQSAATMRVRVERASGKSSAEMPAHF